MKSFGLILVGAALTLMAVSVLFPASAMAAPENSGGGSAQAAPTCTSSFFAIPAWYSGLQSKDGKCQFQPIRDGSDGQTGDVNLTKTIMRIGMNVFQAALVVAGYAAVLFIIIGGFRYMLAAGDPGAMASSKKTITNAIVGLVIAVLAASIVNAIAGIIK
ncbi:MAG: pilin [Candidatus Saccharimonas sp.]